MLDAREILMETKNLASELFLEVKLKRFFSSLIALFFRVFAVEPGVHKCFPVAVHQLWSSNKQYRRICNNIGSQFYQGSKAAGPV